MLSPDSIELADVAAGWRSAYVHIPFCRRRCPYCDFAVVAPGDAMAENLPALSDRYLAALHREIDMEPEWEPLAAVNFGGGTPSAIGAEELGKLIEHLDTRFSDRPRRGGEHRSQSGGHHSRIGRRPGRSRSQSGLARGAEPR